MILEEKIHILTLWLVIWFAILLFLLYMDTRKKEPGAGISMAYLANFFMNHFFGALIYVLPWYRTDEFDYVYLGFEQCVYAIAAYAVGSLFITPFFQRIFSGRRLLARRQEPDRLLPWTYLGVGLVCYLVLGKLLAGIPTLGTCGLFGWFMLITATCLFCWKAWIRGKKSQIFKILLLTAAFPFFTIFNSGFLSYGTTAVLTILFFVASFYRPRWLFLLLVAMAIYMGLSVCVTYFRDREELRQDIWYERKTLSERVERAVSTFGNFEWFDFQNEKHLQRIDARLNQNTFIGHSVVYLGEGQVPYANGSTLWDAVLAMIPRILWPDKPVVAGGSSGGSQLAVQYTDMSLDDTGTSWALGQVMELYINFGTMGVVIGFVVLGALITYLDQLAAACLRAGDWRGFVFFFLPTISFMQAGTFVEVTGGTAAFMILSYFLHSVVIVKMTKKIVKRRNLVENTSH